MRTHRLLPLILAAAAAAAAPRASAADAERAPAAGAAEASALEPPRLEQFVSAPYPAEALERRLEAAVVLELDIDETGRVTDARVREAAGHGFDEAAQAAARAFHFAPARRAGKPVRARILYRYAFTLRPVQAAPAAAEARKLPARSRVSGRVHLANGLQPLPGAEIAIETADGRSLKLTADDKGAWQALDLVPGRVRVRVSAPGFELVEAVETVQPGESLELAHRLRPSGGAIEVTVRGERPEREVTRRTIEREELGVIPGTSGDALKAVQSMPSVARPPGMFGMLVVRGSSPKGTAVFVDGTWVPNVYHFGGMSSVIPTEMLDALDFYPGNFASRYGRVTGGIVEVRLRGLEGDGKLHGLAQVDLIDARAMLRGPLPFAKGWSFIAGFRRSHVDAWLTPILEQQVGVRSAPVYYDYQAFVGTRPTPRSEFRIGVFGSHDAMAISFKDALDNDPGFAGGFGVSGGFTRVQSLYRNEISPDLSVSATLAGGVDTEHMKAGSMIVDGTYYSVSGRGEISYRLSRAFRVRLGPDVLVYPYDVDVRAPQPPREGEEMIGPYSEKKMMVLRETGTLTAPAAFGEIEWTPDERTTIRLGGRVDYFNKNRAMDVAPRLNVRYDLHHDFPRTTAKAGVGHFYEPPQPVEVTPPFGSKSVTSNRATHYALGVEQEVTDRIDLSLEGFYKDLDNLVVRSLEADGANNYRNLGSGSVIGLETLLRYKPRGRFFGWVAHTMSRSTRRDGPADPERLFEFDQTHILTVLGSYDLGRGWKVGGRFRVVTGNPYTPCVGNVLNAAAGAYWCVQGPQFSRRLPPFHQLDLRVDKKWSFEDWSLTAYVDIQNVYNRQNPEGISYNYNYTQTSYQTGIPIIPSVGVRGEF
jgi:TonB family protein